MLKRMNYGEYGVVAFMLVALLVTTSFVTSIEDRAPAESSSIWSKPEFAFAGKGDYADGLAAMQGIELDSGVDYDLASPMVAGNYQDIFQGLESNISKLDAAMYRSSEILRSLKTESEEDLDYGQVVQPQEEQMRIEDFALQGFEAESQQQEQNIGRAEIVGVDISLPGGLGEMQRRSCRHESVDTTAISSATMKVVGVLLKFGMEERALSMIESEILGVDKN